MRSTMRVLSASSSACPSARSMPSAVRHLLRRRLDAGEAVRSLDDQASADRDRDGGEDGAVLDQRELGGAAADVDVEQRLAVAARQRDRARAVRRHLAFHVVAGGGADELAGLLRKEVGDGARVRALDRLAGKDHGATVDLVALDARIGIGAADEAREFVDVDGVVRQVRRQQDRRLPQQLAADDDEAARQRGSKPLQVHAREHQVRGRRADVDADGGQLDVVGRPRDLVERPFARIDVQMLEFEVVHAPTARAASGSPPAARRRTSWRSCRSSKSCRSRRPAPPGFPAPWSFRRPHRSHR